MKLRLRSLKGNSHVEPYRIIIGRSASLAILDVFGHRSHARGHVECLIDRTLVLPTEVVSVARPATFDATRGCGERWVAPGELTADEGKRSIEGSPFLSISPGYSDWKTCSRNVREYSERDGQE